MANNLLRISLLLSFMAISSVVHADHNYQHHTPKVNSAPASEQFRSSNAYAAPAYVTVRPDWSRYNRGMSVPAGR